MITSVYREIVQECALRDCTPRGGGDTNIRAAHDPRRVDHLLDHHLVERGLFKVIVNPPGDVSSSSICSAMQVAFAKQLPGIPMFSLNWS